MLYLLHQLDPYLLSLHIWECRSFCRGPCKSLCKVGLSRLVATYGGTRLPNPFCLLSLLYHISISTYKRSVIASCLLPEIINPSCKIVATRLVYFHASSIPRFAYFTSLLELCSVLLKITALTHKSTREDCKRLLPGVLSNS
jgi:hypothetical protein